MIAAAYAVVPCAIAREMDATAAKCEAALLAVALVAVVAPLVARWP